MASSIPFVRPFHTVRGVLALCCLCAASALSAPPGQTAGERKDVTDPALREIITSFSRRLPRFMNRHGETLFVTDEQMTRGSFLYALYEYDRSLKAILADPGERPGEDPLAARVAVLERERTSSATIEPSAALSRVLPSLLDTALPLSKKFLAISSRTHAQETALSDAVNDMALVRAELTSLRPRIAASSAAAADPDRETYARLIKQITTRLDAHDTLLAISTPTLTSPRAAPQETSAGIERRLQSLSALYAAHDATILALSSAVTRMKSERQMPAQVPSSGSESALRNESTAANDAVIASATACLQTLRAELERCRSSARISTAPSSGSGSTTDAPGTEGRLREMEMALTHQSISLAQITTEVAALRSQIAAIPAPATSTSDTASSFSGKETEWKLAKALMETSRLTKRADDLEKASAEYILLINQLLARVSVAERSLAATAPRTETATRSEIDELRERIKKLEQK